MLLACNRLSSVVNTLSLCFSSSDRLAGAPQASGGVFDEPVLSLCSGGDGGPDTSRRWVAVPEPVRARSGSYRRWLGSWQGVCSHLLLWVVVEASRVAVELAGEEKPSLPSPPCHSRDPARCAGGSGRVAAKPSLHGQVPGPVPSVPWQRS